MLRPKTAIPIHDSTVEEVKRTMHPAEELALKLHKKEYATSKTAAHVYQVWEDGEITFQKCGDLLWHRNLHMMVPAPTHYVAGLRLPVKWDGGHSFAYVANEEEAVQIRKLIEVKS